MLACNSTFQPDFSTGQDSKNLKQLLTTHSNSKEPERRKELRLTTQLYSLPVQDPLNLEQDATHSGWPTA